MCRYLLNPNLSNLSTGLAQGLPHFCGIVAALHERVVMLGDSIAWGRCFFLIQHRDTSSVYLYTLRIIGRRLQCRSAGLILRSGGAGDGVDKDADGSDR